MEGIYILSTDFESVPLNTQEEIDDAIRGIIDFCHFFVEDGQTIHIKLEKLANNELVAVPDRLDAAIEKAGVEGWRERTRTDCPKGTITITKTTTEPRLATLTIREPT